MSLSLTRKDSTVLSKTAAEVLDILTKLKLSETNILADSVLYYALDPSTIFVFGGIALGTSTNWCGNCTLLPPTPKRSGVFTDTTKAAV